MDNSVLWGFHPVYEALRAKRRKIHAIHMVLEKVRPRGETLIRTARNAGISIQGANPQQLTAMVGHKRHQGICAKVTDYPLSSIDTILRQAESRRQAAFILALDQIVDPQNFGAIARTANCAGIHGIVIPKHRSAPPSAAASKASAGALEHMHVACVNNLVDALKHLKFEGLWLAGADQNGRETVFEADLTGPLAIIVGGEEKGIRPLVKKQCDFLVAVPQTGPIGSLNASAAAAVIMYEAFRQRRS
ncbi:MAG: 23S rRNA (guanosine(2251)-2'-O)-methyltransferase RlmB [Desulfobacteraceae bacterium]|jgi:23S rRNA (guanosine2251-2'-O)-methyltransferase